MEGGAGFGRVGDECIGGSCPGERAWARDAGAGPAQVTTQTCRKAEVNPVTGHVLCIDPLGAPVAPPPSASEVPCKPDARADQAWSYGPKCKSEKPGEG